MSADLDDRWEWIELRRFGDPGPTYTKGACRHRDVVPVDSALDGEVVAHLCLTCDAHEDYEALNADHTTTPPPNPSTTEGD